MSSRKLFIFKVAYKLNHQLAIFHYKINQHPISSSHIYVYVVRYQNRTTFKFKNYIIFAFTYLSHKYSALFYPSAYLTHGNHFLAHTLALSLPISSLKSTAYIICTLRLTWLLSSRFLRKYLPILKFNTCHQNVGYSSCNLIYQQRHIQKQTHGA